MFKQVLVPLDGSELAEKALSYARALATGSSTILLVRATGCYPMEDAPAEEQLELFKQAELALAETVQRLDMTGLTAIPHVYGGDPAAAILKVASVHGADLIAMSTHGRGGLGRWAFGSVAERVLHQATCPILLISPYCERSWPEDRGGTVIVAVDGSPFAEQAIDSATQLAKALGATITLVQVVEPPNPELQSGLAVQPESPPLSVVEASAPYLERLISKVESKGATATAEVGFGHPATTIARLAREKQVDAIVMATHGRTGLAHGLMGSVALGVVQRADVPLLLVRPTVARAPRPEPASKGQMTVATFSSAEADLVREGLELLVTTRGDGNLAEAVSHILDRLRADESW